MASLRMSVVKRNGKRELVNFDKITKRIECLCWPSGSKPSKTFETPLAVNASKIAATVCASVVDGITTEKLDDLTADAAASMSTEHPDYGILAARIVISNLQKQTSPSLLSTYRTMKHLMSRDFMDHIAAKHLEYQAMIDYDRDYDFDYFGFKTMEKLYLTRVDGKITERPQHMFMRVAMALWGDDLERVKETYDALSTQKFTHASPTLFNAGLKNQQLASCFTKGTKVSTVNRGPVNIEDVFIGDLVVTHTGSTRPVVQIHANPLGERKLYDLHVYKTPVVSVTENHRFWAMTSKNKKTSKCNPEWISVDDLNVGDYVAIPSRTEGVASEETSIDVFPIIVRELGDTYGIVATDNVIDIVKNIVRPDWLNDRTNIITCPKKMSSVKRHWTITEDFAWFLGVWYGDGCVTGYKGKMPDHISIASNPNNIHLIERVCRVGKETFGIEPHVQYAKGQQLATIRFHSKAVAVAFASLFGRGHLGKRMFKDAYTWNASLVHAFLGGLISSDGCVTSTGSITVSITNRDLLEGFYHLGRQVGVDVSFKRVKKPDDWKYCSIWNMTIPRVDDITRHIYKVYGDERMDIQARTHSNSIVVCDGITFLRIKGKTPSTKPDTVVYTLGVDTDHSYTVEGLVCENCFLMTTTDDSIAGIYDTLAKCAHISKYGGGIGVAISNIRGKGSKIKGTNGESDGIVPMARVFDATVAYVNQGGRRKGALAMYLEPHHPDIFEFLDLKRNQGEESLRARNLFYAMWISDLFMRRVESNGVWSLLDPSTCPGLDDAHSDVYDALYERYESEGMYVRQVRAQDLWTAIVRSQIETGGPYILFKDAANAKSNQQNLGTIKCSNLCVAGDTKILTSTGYHPIGDLVGQHVRVWNGDEFSDTTIVHTGKNQPLVTVTFDNGSEIRCTPYHKFFVVADTFEDDSLEARACDLVPGHRIFPFRFPDDSTDVCVSVVSVVDHGDIEDTFCFNEPKKHAGMFNGILAGNCSEIIEYTSKDEIAVCTLGSLSLPAFVNEESGTYDFEGLLAATKVLAKNLDRIIDINFYPVPEAMTSNERHRPVGVGVQGLANVFFKLKMPFDSLQAKSLNRDIFETIYYGCLVASNDLAKIHGPYSTFQGSPASRGTLQFDLWNAPTRMHWDWDALKKDIVTYGLRNSLSVAPMPTASTAQFLSNVEAMEPQTSNLYSRRTLAGEFPVINTNLVRHLIERGTWSVDMKNKIVANGGSVQNVIGIHPTIKDVYKTAWEMSMRTIIDMAADRGAFVCQSQSLNCFVAEPTIKNLSSMHFHAWKSGLKTGCYYLRTKAASSAIKVTTDCIACSS